MTNLRKTPDTILAQMPLDKKQSLANLCDRATWRERTLDLEDMLMDVWVEDFDCCDEDDVMSVARRLEPHPAAASGGLGPSPGE